MLYKKLITLSQLYYNSQVQAADITYFFEQYNTN